ncbi:hybrid sensor histidine kinase/response regulator, partial [bacterium]|nr:hybrid sensor histidine kinase/response regulator [bacterium]
MDFQDDELKELLNIFRVESEEIIERLNTNLLELEKKSDNKELIILLFRDAHSIKGAARMIGFSQTQQIAHTIEDILSLAKENKIKLTSKIADVMYQSVDLMAKIINQSLDKGKEVYKKSEVQKQTELLENIKNLNSEASEEDIESDIQRNNVVKTDNSENINIIIEKSYNCLSDISKNFDKQIATEFFSYIEELIKYFNNEDDFEIKNELETIKLKLDLVLKFDSTLTPQETDEIKNRMDKVLSDFNYTAKAADFDNIESADENNCENIEKEVIELFEEVKEKISDISISKEQIPEIISDFENIISKINDEKIISLLKKINELLDYINKTDIVADESQAEIITNAVNYCLSCLNNTNTTEDVSLLQQQLTVAKQLIELSAPVENSIFESQDKISDEIKNFSKILSNSEIKTLHVDSSKLDIMVNQVGELISSKIKASKQINELVLLKKELEEFQKNFIKISSNLKSYENKKILSNYSTTDSSLSNSIIKQSMNMLFEQNNKMNDIILKYENLLRLNSENDAKMSNIIDDFEQMIKNIRVLPFATIFHMFGRMVRDIANERGKKVDLKITGSETSVDKKIIEEIKNPLIHIIRNSIDHGIETPQRRKELGKSQIGHLEINAKLLDNKIYIEIKDDGQGFNIQKIKDKAVQKGFLNKEELENMDEDDIINLVFLPGFTTGEEVTSISGRGIGMDVVKSKISHLNGTVKVVSEYNKGCSIQIKIPVKVATLSVFLIVVSGQIFAVPMSVINTVTFKKEEEIINNNNSMSILHNGKNIPVYFCSELMQLKQNDKAEQYKTIIILETNNKKMGIIVDKLLGEQEILHKKFSPPIYKIKNISGLTTLDDGEICLILNVSELMNNSLFSNNTVLKETKVVSIIDKETMAGYKKILFVDDSLTSRTFGKNILSGYGYDVETAENPIAAFKLLNKTRYDLIISDVEMPIMNGFDFLSQLKSNELY